MTETEILKEIATLRGRLHDLRVEKRRASVHPATMAIQSNGKQRRDPKAHAAAVREIKAQLGGLRNLAAVVEADRLGLIAKLELRPDAQDLTKTEFGPYVVAGYAGSAGSPTPWWRVRCRACSYVTFERGNALRGGRGVSCFRCAWSGQGPKRKPPVPT